MEHILVIRSRRHKHSFGRAGPSLLSLGGGSVTGITEKPLMKNINVTCDGCGAECPGGQFLTVQDGPGSPELRALYGGERHYCGACLESHANLDRQRRHGDADKQPVRLSGQRQAVQLETK